MGPHDDYEFSVTSFNIIESNMISILDVLSSLKITHLILSSAASYLLRSIPESAEWDFDRGLKPIRFRTALSSVRCFDSLVHLIVSSYQLDQTKSTAFLKSLYRFTLYPQIFLLRPDIRSAMPKSAWK